MSLFHKLIYAPKINWFIRNTTYLFSSFLPGKVKIHPSGRIKIKVNSNTSFYLKTNQTSYLTRELFWKRAEGFEYTTIFIGLIKKTAVFLDIGANIGYYSILGCSINDRLTVYAFEPSTGPIAYLFENIQINNVLNNVFAEQLALSDTSGEIDFYEIKNAKFPEIKNLSGEHNIGTKKDKISCKTKVSSITLDEYTKVKSIEAIDLIKLDTEGAEVLILKGAKDTINRNKPIIICETLFNKIENKLDAIMREYNYKFYNHTHDGLEEVASIIRTKDDGVRNCFFVPEDKVHMIKEWVV